VYLHGTITFKSPPPPERSVRTVCFTRSLNNCDVYAPSQYSARRGNHHSVRISHRPGNGLLFTGSARGEGGCTTHRGEDTETTEPQVGRRGGDTLQLTAWGISISGHHTLTFTPLSLLLSIYLPIYLSLSLSMWFFQTRWAHTKYPSQINTQIYFS
jgi:hypothetical protein